MKGFDARQGITPRGEAAIQTEVENILRRVGIFYRRNYRLWTGREQADFAIGFSERFITHLIEVESAVSWSEGLRQALWYRAAYFNKTRRQAIPVLMLFGDASRERFRQVIATCDNNHVALLAYKLTVAGRSERTHSFRSLVRARAAT